VNKTFASNVNTNVLLNENTIAYDCSSKKYSEYKKKFINKKYFTLCSIYNPAFMTVFSFSCNKPRPQRQT